MCQTFNETTRHFLIAGTVGSDDDILVVNMENAYIPLSMDCPNMLLVTILKALILIISYFFFE